MSRRRRNHRSMSNDSRMSQRSQPQSPANHYKFLKTTAQTFYVPRQITSIRTIFCSFLLCLHFVRHIYSYNLCTQSAIKCQKSHYLATFSSSSQKYIKSNYLKEISDFQSKKTRLSGAYYRWHNQSGLNNKWAANFQCALRDYGQKNQHFRKIFAPMPNLQFIMMWRRLIMKRLSSFVTEEANPLTLDDFLSFLFNQEHYENYLFNRLNYFCSYYVS